MVGDDAQGDGEGGGEDEGLEEAGEPIAKLATLLGWVGRPRGGVRFGAELLRGDFFEQEASLEVGGAFGAVEEVLFEAVARLSFEFVEEVSLDGELFLSVVMRHLSHPDTSS